MILNCLNYHIFTVLKINYNNISFINSECRKWDCTSADIQFAGASTSSTVTCHKVLCFAFTSERSLLWGSVSNCLNNSAEKETGKTLEWEF